jgi:3-oxoacyl-[acyl-carrier protein] reductase
MAHLANKTALITGASRGMGRATALALAGAGARVIVHYGRKADEANAVADQIRKARGHADAISSDLAKPDGAHQEEHYAHGFVYRAKADYDQAIADFSRAIALNPNSALAHYDRGLAYRAKADYDQANADFNRAIEIDPKMPWPTSS